VKSVLKAVRKVSSILCLLCWTLYIVIRFTRILMYDFVTVSA